MNHILAFVSISSVFVKPVALHRLVQISSLNIVMKRNMSGDILSDKNPLTIATHNGVFHADETLACYILKILYPHASIVRTRDPEVYNKCDIVVDVGGVYDPETNRFDHHQKSFDQSMSVLSDIQSTVKLSSAGLVYHHFGKSILRKIVAKEDELMINYIYKQLYFNLIQEIDGVDNGIPAYDAEPLYNIHSHISTRISRLNKPWLPVENWDELTQFQKAMDMVGEEFMTNVKILKDDVYPAREIVWSSIQNRYDVHPSGEIIEFLQHCPWKNHFFELEEIHKIEPQIKFVLFKGDDSYRVQAVSITSKSYVCRKALPQPWCGLRDEKLSQVAGIEGCIFAHANGFIGGHVTREGALQMAIKSLQYTTNGS